MRRTYPPRRLGPYMDEVLDEIGGTLGGWNVEEFPYPRGPDRYGIYFEARGVRATPRRYQVTVVREGDAWRLCGFER